MQNLKNIVSFPATRHQAITHLQNNQDAMIIKDKENV